MKERWICYLVFDATGVQRLSKGAPSLRSGERAVRLRLRVPSATFARAFPEAAIEIPEEAIVTPTVTVVGPEGGAAQKVVT